MDMKVETHKEDDTLLLISTDNWKTHDTVVLIKGKDTIRIKLSVWDKIKLFFINHYT